MVMNCWVLNVGFQLFYNITKFDRPMEEDSFQCKMEHSWPPSNESHSPHPSPSLDSMLQDLHHAKQRFRAFAEHLGQMAVTPIRQDITKYCLGQRKQGRGVDNVMKPEALLKKIEVRIDKMLKTKRLKRNWGEEDLKILIWVVSKYADQHQMTDLEKDMGEQDWGFVASVIPGVTGESCMFKWLSIKKITLATHNWTLFESQLLGNAVRTHLQCIPADNLNWKDISQQLYKLNTSENKVYRNAKQCRQHWTCYLSPQLKKGPWQLYEDVKLLKYIKDNKGLKKWSEIARHFEGRTENALKNRYTLIIDKQKRQPKNKNKPQLDLISEYLEKCYVDQFTTNIKVQENLVYGESSEQVAFDPIIPIKQEETVKREEQLQDTNDPLVTPVRVQKFNFQVFELMNNHFFRSIQPGIIQSDGTFKKINSTISNSSGTGGQPQIKIEQSPKIMPFTLEKIERNDQ